MRANNREIRGILFVYFLEIAVHITFYTSKLYLLITKNTFDITMQAENYIQP